MYNNKFISGDYKKVNEDKGTIFNNDKNIGEIQNNIIHNNSYNNFFKNNESDIVNKSKQICLNKDAIKEIQSQKNNYPQKNKFLDNIQILSLNYEDKTKALNQVKNMKKEYLTMNSAPINSDNENENFSNFNDKLKNFEIKKNDINSNSIQKKKEINQEKEEKTNILSSIKRNSVDIDQKDEQKGIHVLLTKFLNTPKKSIGKKEDKINKKNNEEIINNLSKDTDINNNETNSNNLGVKEEAIKTPIIDSISNDKINKSIIGTNTKNLSNNKNDSEFLVLNQEPINSELPTNSFCRAFFITSFPKNDPKIYEYSQNLKANCAHLECSFLPGFQPEIIYKYPQKDSKELEIDNILASICFPNSIKVCLIDKEDSLII